jgi:hypothetical protein
MTETITLPSSAVVPSLARTLGVARIGHLVSIHTDHFTHDLRSCSKSFAQCFPLHTTFLDFIGTHPDAGAVDDAAKVYSSRHLEDQFCVNGLDVIRQHDHYHKNRTTQSLWKSVPSAPSVARKAQGQGINRRSRISLGQYIGAS